MTTNFLPLYSSASINIWEVNGKEGERQERRCKTDAVTNTNPFLAYFLCQVLGYICYFTGTTSFMLYLENVSILLKQKYNFENK